MLNSNFAISLLSHLPSYAPLLNHLSASSNFHLNYNLQLRPTSSNRLVLHTLDPIRQSNHLFLLATSYCLLSTSFIGATPVYSTKLSSHLSSLNQQYEFLTSELLGRLALTIQVIANSKYLYQGQMPLHIFANYILKHYKPRTPLTYQYIPKNPYLQQLYHSNKTGIYLAYNVLHNYFIKGIQLYEFLHAFAQTKQFIRQYEAIQIIAPFIEFVDHSLYANCQLYGLHLTHRQQSFITLKTIKDIQTGYRLTINYGELGNYYLFFRYGFTISNNSYSYYFVPIDYTQLMELFNEDIDVKQYKFRISQQKLRNQVRIMHNGKIRNEDMLMLRILFDNGKSDRETVNKEIYQFVKKQCLQAQLVRKSNTKEYISNHHLKTIEEYGNAIVWYFLAAH